MKAHSPWFSAPARRGRMATALFLLVVGLLLALGPFDDGVGGHGRGLAQGEPTCGTGSTAVCVLPASQVAETGATFAAEVVADNVTNLGAYQFTLSFDPGIVSFVGGTDASFLGSTGRDVSCFGPSASGGSVSMTCITTTSGGPPGPDGPNGAGTLASLQFSGLVPGDSPLALSDVIITDIEGNSIPASTLDADVTIIQGPTPTPCPGGVCPTSTATATLTPTATPAGGVTTVRVDPPSQTQQEGSTFPVSVVVENVTDLASYQFTLAFDNTALEFLDVTNGTFLGSTGRPVFCPSSLVGENTVRMACVTSGGTPAGPSGSGVLAELSFRAASGSFAGTPTLVDLFDVELSDPLGNDIPKEVQDGTVIVEAPTPTPCPGGVCPTATPTSSPTPTPTPFTDVCVAGSGADVCVKPASLDVSAGDGFSVDIVADDVTNLGAFSFTLGFDSSILAFDSATGGPFLGSSGREVTCLSPVVGSDDVTFNCLTTEAAPPGPDGAGILASVDFTAGAEGTSPLSLLSVTLSDIEGTAIPTTDHDGTVTVFPGPVPTATVTPTATPTSATPSPTPTPATATLVWIDPATQAVEVGASPTIDVRIDDVTDLGSYEWQITYDPAVLDFVDVVDGPFLGSTGRSVFCPGAILDVGSVRFGCVTSGTTPAPPSGSGVLSTVTFSALAEGTSALTFTFASLSDPLGDDIPTNIQHGEIVVSTPTSTPTSTATPIVAPGAIPPAEGSGGGTPPIQTLTGMALVSAGLVLIAPDLLGAVRRYRRKERWLPAAGRLPWTDDLGEVDDDA